VANALAALIGSVPSALDTLDQLASALGDDPNFATTITNALATKVAIPANLSGLTDAVAARANIEAASAAAVTAHTTATNNLHRVTQVQVGLGNVSYTADADKTFSAAQVTSGQLAMGRIASGTLDGTKFVRDDGVLATPAGASALAPARPKRGTTYGWGAPGVEFNSVTTQALSASRHYYISFLV
jgi:hypothetical protein